MSRSPDKLCVYHKQKQTRTKKSEQLAQTSKSNTYKFWRKHNITKLAPEIVSKKKQETRNKNQFVIYKLLNLFDSCDENNEPKNLIKDLLILFIQSIEWT